MGVHISGRTRLAGIIGMPVEHSASPAMHNAAYEALGLEWAYVPLPVAEEAHLARVVSAIRVLPFVGFNVTMPYKDAMLELCDEVALTARLAGAVNAVHCADGRLVGYNTDGRGLIDSLAEDLGFDPAGKRVVVLGAGGAAGAAVVSLVLAKAGQITVVNRTYANAEDLVERITPHARDTRIDAAELGETGEESVSAADLIVNATPIGMEPGDPAPVPAKWLRANHVVADMIYAAADTPLVAAARASGAHAVDGLGMLVCQGATAIEIWSEGAQLVAPRDIMRAAAQRELRLRAERGGGAVAG
ncbi:MAG: shikimate dehydrogenase [Clostridiales bacterium]|nr:shikimate dehydrogenase [Clostridiales bacterium]